MYEDMIVHQGKNSAGDIVLINLYIKLLTKLISPSTAPV